MQIKKKLSIWTCFSNICVFSRWVGACMCAQVGTLMINKRLYILSFPGLKYCTTISSVQFSQSVVSDSLWPHEPQQAKPPCPSPTGRVYPNQCPLSRWFYPTVSSSVVPFSSCPQSLRHQGLFKWVSSPHQVAKVLGFQLQHQFLQWIPRTDLL